MPWTARLMLKFAFILLAFAALFSVADAQETFTLTLTYPNSIEFEVESSFGAPETFPC
jgi:hypothetical protein